MNSRFYIACNAIARLLELVLQSASGSGRILAGSLSSAYSPAKYSVYGCYGNICRAIKLPLARKQLPCLVRPDMAGFWLNPLHREVRLVRR